MKLLSWLRSFVICVPRQTGNTEREGRERAGEREGRGEVGEGEGGGSGSLERREVSMGRRSRWMRERNGEEEKGRGGVEEERYHLVWM